jgi:hypothetical protein
MYGTRVLACGRAAAGGRVAVRPSAVPGPWRRIADIDSAIQTSSRCADILFEQYVSSRRRGRGRSCRRGVPLCRSRAVPRLSASTTVSRHARSESYRTKYQRRIAHVSAPQCCAQRSTWCHFLRRQLGFPLVGTPAAKIKMEMFGDNLCAFTKRSWPTVKALAEHYSSNNDLEILVHWFPVRTACHRCVSSSPRARCSLSYLGSFTGLADRFATCSHRGCRLSIVRAPDLWVVAPAAAAFPPQLLPDSYGRSSCRQYCIR